MRRAIILGVLILCCGLLYVSAGINEDLIAAAQAGNLEQVRALVAKGRTSRPVTKTAGPPCNMPPEAGRRDRPLPAGQGRRSCVRRQVRQLDPVEGRLRRLH